MATIIPGRSYPPTLEQGFSEVQIERYHEQRRERLRPPEDELAIKRLLGVFESATDDELAEGLRWYADARLVCAQMSIEFASVPSAKHAAGIIAALSPRTSWTENIQRAIMLARSGLTHGTRRSIADATAILKGEDPRSVLCDPSRSNYKTRAFFLNMAEPLESAVTVDRHGFAMLYDDRTIGSVLLRPSEALYRWAEEMFAQAAAEKGLLPHDFQAVTWVVWRAGDVRRRRAAENMPTLF